MPQKRHAVDQIVANLREMDVALCNGKSVPEICKLLEVVARSHRTDLLSLTAEVRRHETRDGQATESLRERERAAEDDGCRASP